MFLEGSFGTVCGCLFAAFFCVLRFRTYPAMARRIGRVCKQNVFNCVRTECRLYRRMFRAGKHLSFLCFACRIGY